MLGCNDHIMGEAVSHNEPKMSFRNAPCELMMGDLSESKNALVET